MKKHLAWILALITVLAVLAACTTGNGDDTTVGDTTVTDPATAETAVGFMRINALFMPLHGFLHSSYFTLRSGGKTLITFLFDSVYTWCVPVVISFLLCRYTTLGIVLIYFIVQFSDIIKICIGLPMLMSGIWAKNIIKENK